MSERHFEFAFGIQPQGIDGFQLVFGGRAENQAGALRQSGDRAAERGFLCMKGSGNPCGYEEEKNNTFHGWYYLL
jgi:hypothetical protein